MKIAIMQPTFLPWIGYFGMIGSVDRFVFLDNVQFSKRSWQQRNRIKVAGQELFITVPVLNKGKREQLIRETLIDQEHFIPHKILTSVSQGYSKAPNFKQGFNVFQDAFSKKYDSLCQMNVEFIQFFCSILGIETPFLMASSLPVQGNEAELLADICEKLKADTYLSAPGSREYIEQSTAFSDKGVRVEYHEYQHPTYHQLGTTFLPYMSVLDLYLNEGPASLDVIKSGYQR